MSSFDVVVVGGGMVGTATAYELGRPGARTLLVDRADAGPGHRRGRRASCRPRRPSATTRHGSSSCSLRAGTTTRFCRELGPDTGWARCGILQLATRETDLSGLGVGRRARDRRDRDQRRRRARDGAGARHGRPRAASSAGGARRRPHDVRGAAARRRAARRAGARRLGRRGARGSPATVVVDGDAIRRAVVVIAGGAWTRRLGEQLGVHLPVGPVRGQIAHLGVAEHDTGSWPIVQQVYGHYMVPWADHRVAVGATVEDAGFAPDVDRGRRATRSCARRCA